MDYEQMYKDAFKRAKEYHDLDEDNTMQVHARGVMEYLFPVLAESEDKRIRKALIEAIEQNYTLTGDINYVHTKDILAWLKKQGEQKPYTFNAIPRLLEMIKPTDKAKAYCQKLIDSLEKEGYKKDAKIVDGFLKQWNGEEVPMATMDEQNPVWSEEDERMFNQLILRMDGYHYKHEVLQTMKRWLQERLKSLKPQPHWKPSKEQIDILFKYAEQNNYDGSILTSLYNDLKKL